MLTTKCHKGKILAWYWFNWFYHFWGSVRCVWPSNIWHQIASWMKSQQHGCLKENRSCICRTIIHFVSLSICRISWQEASFDLQHWKRIRYLCMSVLITLCVTSIWTTLAQTVAHPPPTSEVSVPNPRPHLGKLVLTDFVLLLTDGRQFSVQNLGQLHVLVTSAT